MLLGLFMMVVLFYAGVTFHRLLPTELHAANALNADRQARYVAEAGVMSTLAALEKRLARGQSLGEEVRRGRLGDWRWQTRCRALSRDEVEVVSTATDPKHNSRLRVTARAQRQSFARYTLFLDRESGLITFDRDSATIEGRVHLNSPLRIRGVEAGFYERRQPLFRGRVSVHETTADEYRGDGVRYISADGRSWSPLDSRPYDAEGNPVPGRYERLSALGREGLQSGATEVALPDPLIVLREQASAGLVSTQQLLWVAHTGDNMAGGVVIHGPLRELRLTLEGSGGRGLWITGESGRQAAFVEALFGPVEMPDGQVLEQGNSAAINFVGDGVEVTRFRGLSNGLVAVEGEVGSFSGSNRGLRTLIFDSRVRITGDVLRADVDRRGERSLSSGDNLGLVAAQAEIPLEVGTSRYLYGEYFLGNSDESRAGLVISGRGPASLWLSGGLQASEIATTISEGQVSWKLDADPLQASEPPPSYPQAPQLKLGYWREDFLE